MPIYIKYGDIKGDVTAAGHEGKKGWVEIYSFDFGAARTLAMVRGRGSDREASAPVVHEIQISKHTDVSSTAWFEEALHGEGKAAKIHVCKTGKEALDPFQSYELENAIVTGFSLASNGDMPMENISISFTKFTFGFEQMDASGEITQSPRTGYDVAAARKL